MVTEHDIAALCLGIYPGQPPIEWDEVELPDDGIAFGLKSFDTVTAVIFRGSVTLADWLRDGETVADPLEQHPRCFRGRFHWCPRISHLRAIDRDRRNRRSGYRECELRSRVRRRQQYAFLCP